MLKLEALSNLVEALDRFLEAAARADKQRIIEPAIRKIEKYFSRFFREQGKRVAAANAKHKKDYPTLEEALRKEDVERILSAVKEGEAGAAADLVAMLGPVMNASAAATLGEYPEYEAMAFNLENPKAVKWLKQHAAERVTGINMTTKESMRGLISQAVEEGWSYDRTAREIQSRFDGFAGLKPQAHIRSRAHLVAVTESRNAYEEANLQTAKGLEAAGLEMEKKWRDSGDSKVSAGCRENSAAGWIPLDKSFPSGDDRSPRFPGCRCNLLTRAKGSEE